jgi:hypothetical protein
MVSEIRIYAEGGGNKADTKARFREGLSMFLGGLRLQARSKSIHWNITVCGGRDQAYDRFLTALQQHPGAFNVLLVDAEGAVAAAHGPWQHLAGRDPGADIRWPNEPDSRRVAFASKQGQTPPGAEVLNLDHPRIRGLLTRLPRYAPGQTVPRIRMDGLPDTIKGLWSLWQIGMLTSDRRRQKVLPVFVHDDGRVLQPTARFIWQELNTKNWRLHGALTAGDAERIYPQCERAAREQGRELFMQLRQRHLNHIQLEREKTEYSFRARRKLLGEIGLPEVRTHRLRQLVAEEATWRQNLEEQKQTLPDLVPLVVLRIS